MSVSKIRDLTVENRGCQITMIVAMVLVAVGLTFSGAMCSGAQDQQSAITTIPVLTVGEEVVSLQSLEAQVANQQSQFIQALGETSPRDDFNIYGQTLRNETRALALRLIGSELGITVSDEQIVEQAQAEIESFIEQQRLQFQFSGVLQPDATPEQFATEFQLQFGQTPDQFRQSTLDQITSSLENPDARAALSAGVLEQLAVQQLAAQVEVDREEIRRQSEEFNVVRMPIAIPDLEEQALVDRAEEIRAQIESGELTFDAAKQEFAPDSPADPIPLPRATLQEDPDREPLLQLEAGEVSPVIVENGVPVIYRLESIEQPMTEDEFDTVFPSMETQARQEAAAEMVEERVEQVLASEEATWNLTGFEILHRAYEFYQQDSSELGEEERRQRLLELSDEAYNVMLEDPVAEIPAVLTSYVTYRDYIDALEGEPTEDQLQTLAERTEMTLNFTDGVSIRMEMADVYSQIGEGELVGENLLQAALSNAVAFSQVQQQNWVTIQTQLENYEAQGLIAEETALEIQEEYDQWLTGFIEEQQRLVQEQQEIQDEIERNAREAEQEAAQQQSEQTEEDGLESDPTLESPEEAPAGGE